MNLKELEDKILLSEAKRSAANELEATLWLLQVLREVEARRLYLSLGYSSLFDFSVRYCLLSEGSAQRRISAMRLMKGEPAVEEKLKTGELSLTNAARIFSELKREQATPEIRREVIENCLSVSQKECERRLKSFFPALDDSVEIKLTLPRELADKVEKLKKLTSHQNPMQSNFVLFESLVEAELARQMKKREAKDFTVSSTSGAAVTATAAVTAAVEKKREKRNGSQKKRQHSHSVLIRRRIFTRAHQKCEVEGCGSEYRLEIDHQQPLGLGGADTPENLRVLCGAHHRVMTAEAQLGFL